MPGRLFLTRPIGELSDWLGVASPGPEQPPRRNIAPGQQVVAYGPKGLTLMRWGIIPVGRVNARGRPVMETIVNARSETLFEKSAFAGTGRAVVLADGWYEWTGKTRRKTVWAIRAVDDRPLIFAAISDLWTGPGGVEVPQVATVTCAPSADVAPIHDRMGVLLTKEQIGIWLDGDAAEAKALCKPYPPGRLAVTQATGIDWTAG